ncbi:ATP-binding protein [Tabrizicola sp. BL-A-41-H6]|uniref:ATP-binding protein n=1 Tax=Tabrizicola sp. BL-A-41-H6 TaxID=3421107 RepID=UPI003D671513
MSDRGAVLVCLTNIIALVLCCAVARAEDIRPRVLTIVESDSRLPLVRSMLNSIEAGLGPEVTEQGEVYVEYLNLLNFDRPEERDQMREFLATRYGDRALSAVAVLGPNALAFMRDNRDAIAPGVPIVYGALSRAALDQVLDGKVEPAMSGVTNAFDLPATLDLALGLQRDATEIVVVSGSAPFDRQWRATAEEVLADYPTDLPVRFISEASSSAILAEAAGFNPRAVVLYLTVVMDADGNRFIPSQFARSLAAASPAPVWTVYDTMLGTGVVGGHVENLDTTGRAIAAMLRTAIDGAELPAPQEISGAPAVDWRAMRRHGLNVDLLPEGTRILYYEPSLWERYRLWIVAIGGIILAQSATIAALVLHRRLLARSHATLALERAQLTHISRNLRLGQLSASLAHEINQPLAAIQANADAGVRLAGRPSPDLTEIKSIFSDITSDVGRAAATIANLRRLIVKGETTFDKVDLNEAVTATLALAANELSACGAQIQTDLAPERLEVRGNAPQLQQIVLNLAFNAAEAMGDVPESARIVRVTTARQPDGSSTLAVADAGPGVPPDKRADVFRPFVTSKSKGLGVGLAICRNIAEAHGGTLAFTEPQGGGARIMLTLPPPEVAA